ncbi:MAG: protein kinase [Actinobacteria bacterium]|nr:protein kinase [Actinomycetota bacterium]
MLNDRYELTEQLGQGGMAQVFKAVDGNLGRAVAVKILPPSFAHEERFVDRFQQEARAAASLNHRNIVGIYDTGLDEDLHYIVMELVEGPSLDQVVEDVGQVDVDHALDLAVQVTGALQAAHDQGIVHRDIKPSNILFTKDGVAKVSDFGIARVLADATEAMTDTIFGSVRYIAPEQAQARPVDERADIYALGCVLYEMLTGRPPFVGDVPVAVLHQHVSRQPDPPSEVVEGLAPEVDAVVLHALQKDPDERYPSAEMFRADLKRLQAGDSPVLPVAGQGRNDDATRAIRPLDETIAMSGADRTERIGATPAAASGGGGTGPRERITVIDDDGEGPAWWVWVAAFVVAGVLIALLMILLFFGGGGDDDGDVPPLVPETTTARTDAG